jgi:hypothetical protein
LQRAVPIGFGQLVAAAVFAGHVSEDSARTASVNPTDALAVERLDGGGDQPEPTSSIWRSVRSAPA